VALGLGFLALDLLLIPFLYRYLSTLAAPDSQPKLARRARDLMFVWLVMDLVVIGARAAADGLQIPVVRSWWRRGPPRHAPDRIPRAAAIVRLQHPLRLDLACAARVRHFWSRSRPAPAPALQS
jgi:hypothetical protein